MYPNPSIVEWSNVGSSPPAVMLTSVQEVPRKLCVGGLPRTHSVAGVARGLPGEYHGVTRRLPGGYQGPIL